MGKLLRAKRTRNKINTDKKYPRVTVYRSNKYVSAQIVDDLTGKTLVAISEKKLANEKMSKLEKAKKLGLLLAEKALRNKIKKVVFDRGSYAYHGRVKNIAEGLREGGLDL